MANVIERHPVLVFRIVFRFVYFFTSFIDEFARSVTVDYFTVMPDRYYYSMAVFHHHRLASFLVSYNASLSILAFWSLSRVNRFSKIAIAEPASATFGICFSGPIDWFVVLRHPTSQVFFNLLVFWKFEIQVFYHLNLKSGQSL